MENSIGAILSDFKATIDEIVNIPKSNKNDSKEVRVQNSVFENDPIFFFYYITIIYFRQPKNLLFDPFLSSFSFF